MAFEATVRRWGNSVGIVFPKEYVKRKGIRPKQKIMVDTFKKADLSDLFGIAKPKKSMQELKDEAREGWD